MRLQASLDPLPTRKCLQLLQDEYARLDKNKELDLKVDVEEQPDKTPEYDKNKGPERIPKPGLKPMGQPPK